jgi:hypothetical protein
MWRGGGGGGGGGGWGWWGRGREKGEKKILQGATFFFFLIYIYR